MLVMVESSPSEIIEEQRHEVANRLAAGVLAAITAGKRSLEITGGTSRAGRLYDETTYSEVAERLAAEGVNIHATRYRKKVPLVRPPVPMARLVFYDVIDVVNEGDELVNLDMTQRGKRITQLYPMDRKQQTAS